MDGMGMRALDSIDWKMNKAEKQGPGNRIPGTLDGTPSLNKLLNFLEGDRVKPSTEAAAAISDRVETTDAEPAARPAGESVAPPETKVTSSTSGETRAEDQKAVLLITTVEPSIDTARVDRDPPDEGMDWTLVEFANQSFGTHPDSSGVVLNFVEPKVVEKNPDQVHEKPWNFAAAEEIAHASAEDPQVRSSGPKKASTNQEVRQLRSPSEMADIIFNELRAFDGAPKRGFAVTIYGAHPWNAMLTIGPEAGAVKDAESWRSRVQDLGVRLRRDFEVVETKPSNPKSI
jgi:hypothetical protein